MNLPGGVKASPFRGANFEQQVMAALHRIEQELAAIKREVESIKRNQK